MKPIGFSFGQLDMNKVRAAETEHETEKKERACTQITKRACSSRLGAAVPCTPPEQSLYGPAETAVAAVPCTPPVPEMPLPPTTPPVVQAAGGVALTMATRFRPPPWAPRCVYRGCDQLPLFTCRECHRLHCGMHTTPCQVCRKRFCLPCFREHICRLRAEERTQAASSASGEDELRKAVDEHFKHA